MNVMTTDATKIGLIVLAAGNSRRMNGKPKQLLEINGKSLLRRAVELAVETNFQTIVVVLGTDYEKQKSEIADLPVRIVSNPDSVVGISSSIKVGVTAVSAQRLDALVVMLCDQPLLNVENLTSLRDLHIKTKSLIVASAYENIVGVPALFARPLFGELLSLSGDQGAKKIISKYIDSVVSVPASAASFDIDTSVDFENVKKFFD